MEPWPASHPDAPSEPSRRVIPTGSLRLDAALGIGGIPLGWITEVYGAEGTGKTTLCLLLAAAAQRQGGLCAWVDADQTLDPAYAIQCGIDPDLLFLVDPHDSGQALSIVHSLVMSDCLSLVVVDSAGSLVTEEELLTPMGQPSLAGSDALLARSLPGLSLAARQSRTALVFTNRSWPGAPPVYHQLNSRPEKLSLKLHAAIRLQVTRCQAANSGARRTVRLQLRCTKNSFSENVRAFPLDIVYNEDRINTGDIFDLSSALSIIEQQGEHYFYQDTLLGKSREDAVEALILDRSLARELEEVVRRRIALRD